MIEKFLTTEDVAGILRVAPGTVENWRYKKEGPAYIKLNGRFIRYRERDVQAFIDAQQPAAA